MARAEELVRKYGRDAVTVGILPEEVENFSGLPSLLLQHIRDRLELTPAQIDAMQQLQYELSPALSFPHRFQHKNYVPGYSMDFARAFSNYAFHGARYYARTKYVPGLRQNIDEARKVGGNRASRIANYMADHLKNTILDAKGDYGIFKAGIFFLGLGYVPAAGTQNLLQTPLVTLPYFATG